VWGRERALFRGDMGTLFQCLHHAEKWWFETIFKRVLDIIRHLKGENKWESSRRLDSNGLDIGSYWRVQNNDFKYLF